MLLHELERTAHPLQHGRHLLHLVREVVEALVALSPRAPPERVQLGNGLAQGLAGLLERLDRVVERDWFGAPNRAEAEAWLARCEHMLEEFEAQVFARDGRTEDGRPPLEIVPAAEATG